MKLSLIKRLRLSLCLDSFSLVFGLSAILIAVFALSGFLNSELEYLFGAFGAVSLLTVFESSGCIINHRDLFSAAPMNCSDILKQSISNAEVSITLFTAIQTAYVVYTGRYSNLAYVFCFAALGLITAYCYILSAWNKGFAVTSSYAVPLITDKNPEDSKSFRAIIIQTAAILSVGIAVGIPSWFIIEAPEKAILNSLAVPAAITGAAAFIFSQFLKAKILFAE